MITLLSLNAGNSLSIWRKHKSKSHKVIKGEHIKEEQRKSPIQKIYRHEQESNRSAFTIIEIICSRVMKWKRNEKFEKILSRHTSEAYCSCFLISRASTIKWGCSWSEEHLCCHGSGNAANTFRPKAQELSRDTSRSDRLLSLRFRKKWTYRENETNIFLNSKSKYDIHNDMK